MNLRTNNKEEIMKTNKFAPLFIAVLLMTACSKDIDVSASSETLDEASLVAESASNSIEESIDDQQGSAYAFQSPTSFDNLARLMLPTANADTACTRPVSAFCNAGVKDANYAGCEVGSNGATLTGDISLTYSDAACGLSNTGDQVQREFDISFTGPRGYFKAETTSASTNNYLGEAHSGGGLITKTAAGWDIEVLGKTRTATYRGRNVLNHSIKTTSPIEITGSLARGNRVANGGEVVISHNLAEYKAKIVANNVTWSSNCCHPVSGSYAITYEGSVTGSASLTFNGCGSAQYVKDNLNKDITLSYCH
jgi:hypothetical protein